MSEETTTAKTDGRAAEPEIPVRLVQLPLCDPCIDGEGDECHTPGCTLWLHSVPAPAIRDDPRVIVGATQQAATAAGATRTSARAAFEEWSRAFDGLDGDDWDDLSLTERDKWQNIVDAAAEAVAAPLRARISELERLAAEILATRNTVVSDEQWDIWRERAAGQLLAAAAKTPASCCEHCDHDPGVIHDSPCENCLSRQLAAARARIVELEAQLTEAKDGLLMAHNAGTLVGQHLAEAQAERDKAYGERAALVAYIAACYPSVMLTDSAEPDWPIVFISTPSGQMSWHIARGDLELFAHVPATTNPTWDGHTTEEKYRRLAELTRTVATGIYGPQPGIKAKS